MSGENIAAIPFSSRLLALAKNSATVIADAETGIMTSNSALIKRRKR